MDVLLTRQARLDLEALAVLGAGAGAWGLLIGHRRGFRYFVESAFPAPHPGGPSAALHDGLNRHWEGRLIGYFAVRAGASFKKTLLGPVFFGSLFLDVRPSKKGLAVRPSAVAFSDRFLLSALSLVASGPEGENRG